MDGLGDHVAISKETWKQNPNGRLEENENEGQDNRCYQDLSLMYRDSCTSFWWKCQYNIKTHLIKNTHSVGLCTFCNIFISPLLTEGSSWRAVGHISMEVSGPIGPLQCQRRQLQALWTGCFCQLQPFWLGGQIQGLTRLLKT